MRVVIVGAGGGGRVVARRLSQRHEVVVVESEQEHADALEDHAAPAVGEGEADTVGTIVGDGTSRLVLAKAFDAEQNCALVALAGTDEINIEAGRIAKEVGFDPVLAVQHQQRNDSAFHDAGITAINRGQLVAELVERSLQFKGAAVPCGIGLGLGEIVEIRLTGTSPVLGRALKDLAPDRWRISAIFRGDELIVPTGTTTLKEADRVLLVGPPAELVSVAQYLRVGTPQFPGQFGPNIVSFEMDGEDESLYREGLALARACQVQQLRRGVRGGRRVEEAPVTDGGVETMRFRVEGQTPADFGEEIKQNRPGVVVVRPLKRPLGQRIMGVRGTLATLCDEINAPVLFCRGSLPYRKILLPVSASDVSIHAAELAIDVSRRLSGSLTAINVDLPRFISGVSEESAHSEVVPVRKLCELYDVPLDYKHHEGNPVRKIVREAKGHDLVVVARTHKRKDSFWSPDVACRIARAAPCSVLVLTVRG